MTGPPTGVRTYESTLYADHPLVGKIWHTHGARFIQLPELQQALAASRLVLLGEKHDNPDHHLLQRELLVWLLETGRVGGVAFEMLDSSSQPNLAALGTGAVQSLPDLKAALGWDEAGWEWDFYGPLIGDVLGMGVQVRAANLAQEEVSEVYGRPLEESIAGVLDAAAVEQLNREVDESHCGMLPASQFPSMVRVQQARDHRMAHALASDLQPDQVNVLVAGNYHVRHDLGVPNYLLSLVPGLRRAHIASLAMLEVSPGLADPAEYLEASTATPPFDYVIFTPAISDEDYCASLRQ